MVEFRRGGTKGWCKQNTTEVDSERGRLGAERSGTSQRTSESQYAAWLLVIQLSGEPGGPPREEQLETSDIQGLDKNKDGGGWWEDVVTSQVVVG